MSHNQPRSASIDYPRLLWTSVLVFGVVLGLACAGAALGQPFVWIVDWAKLILIGSGVSLLISAIVFIVGWSIQKDAINNDEDAS